MKKLLLASLTLIFMLYSVNATNTCLTVTSTTTADYLNEIPSISSQLSSCVVSIPSAAKSIVKDGNLLVTINMNSGNIEQFYVTITNLELASITKGNPATYSHEATLSEATFDKILQSNDALNDILVAVKNKEIKIRATTFIGKIKWFFAKFFLPSPSPSTNSGTQGPTGKPDNCDETYLPGHRNYAENKELWDSYSADTDKVCQSQYGKGIPSPCIHSVQLSIDGNPYYLCWYNE